MSIHQGLTSSEVAHRVAAGKVNAVTEPTSRSVIDILRANLFTRFNALLGILTVIVLTVGSPADSVFGLVIVINSAIGIVQELRAKRTLDRLAILNMPMARVVRDGTLQTIPVGEVVLDDTLELRVGDQVPADGVVLTTSGLEIDESLLTGESEPIVKQARQKVLSGSIVVAGEGYVHVTEVGADSYARKLTSQVKQFSLTRSELVEGTNKLLGYISWAIVIVSPILVWGQIANNDVLQDALVRSIAAITGMIPEGLVLLTSLAFGIAVISLGRRKVLVQQLPAVEGLARVDVICFDKTGTLTEGHIKLDELIMLDSHQRHEAERVLATFSADPSSPTLHALHEAFGGGPLLATKSAVPFSSARKWSSITLETGDSWVMGAPEVVLSDATLRQLQERITPITQDGKRVMALLRTSSVPELKHVPTDVQPVALIVLSEKVRSDAKKTLEFFAQQDVVLKILSGDNPQTVAAVARAVGLPATEPIDARTLPDDTAELADVLQKHSIFGRVTPDQKRAIVRALQFKGRVVAMTGDGVNDALALKDADIGIAMGSGTVATRSVAELVLLDNQFSRLPHVLAEGRRVVGNMERAANLFVIKNVYSLILSLVVTVVSLPFPFLPRHFTVVSSLTIGIPAFFLGLMPNNERYRPGFLWRVLRFSIPVGAVIGLLVFASYLLVGDEVLSKASSLAATVVVMVGVWIIYCLARPLNWQKALLVLLMPTTFVVLMWLPFSRQFLDFSFDYTQIWYAVGLGLVGIVFVEMLWRLGQERSLSGR